MSADSAALSTYSNPHLTFPSDAFVFADSAFLSADAGFPSAAVVSPATLPSPFWSSTLLYVISDLHVSSLLHYP